MNVVKDIKKNIKKGEEMAEKMIEEVEEKIKIKQKKSKESVEEKKTKKISKKSDSKKAENLEKETESESLTNEKELKDKRKELLEKAKKLREKIDTKEVTSEELKEKIKVKKENMLIPLEEYLKAGIYLGTRAVTPNMRPFVYRRRADGLAIFNTDLIDKKIREGIDFLSKFNPEDIIIVCKREAGWRVVKKFGELTRIRTFTKKYPAGILTNKQLPDFFENELTIITDPWIDKNALNDTLKVHKKVLMICDTNNFSKGADQIILGNNKSEKSLGLIFYLLAKGYCKNKGIKAEIPDLEWWTGEIEEERLSEIKNKKSKSKEIIAGSGIMSSSEGYGI